MSRNRRTRETTMTSPLDSLRAAAKTAAPEPEAKSSPKTVLLDYSGKSGADQVHEHTAPRAMIKAGNDPLVLCPGLNIVDCAVRDAYADCKPFAELVEAKQLTAVNLHELTGPQFADLAQRTFSADALELLLEHEQAKPQVAGRASRRSAEVVALLERKLDKAKRRRPLDFSGISGAAKDQASVLQVKAS